VTDKPKRQRRIVGSIVRIALDEKNHTYGRVLPAPLFAFYDLLTAVDLPTEQVLAAKILFQISVMNSAVTSGRWAVIGKKPLENVFSNPPPHFKQDIFHKDRFWLVYNDGREVVASKHDCAGLERSAVWDAEHVEDRLRDHYDGIPNKWFESLKIKD